MNDLINHSQIQGLKELSCEDEPSIFQELLELFITQGQQTLEALQDALSSKDYTAIYACAHKLKGSSGNMGASFLSYLCQSLEEASSEKNDQEVARLSREIKKIFDLSIKCLKTHL